MVLSRVSSWALLAALLCLSACKKETDEDRIKAVVRSALAAGNEKKLGDVFENVLPTFVGPGGADLQDSRRVLLGYFMQNQVLHAFERDLKVIVTGTDAKATLELGIARNREVKKLEDVAATDLDLMIFELALTKTDDGWKFKSATTRRSLPAPS